jgi:hypothetical protein
MIGLAKKYAPLIAERDLGGWMCAYCYRRLSPNTERRSFTSTLGTTYMRVVQHAGMACIDHVIPLSLGGPDHIDNYVLCCKACNTRKRNRLPGEYSLLPRST